MTRDYAKPTTTRKMGSKKSSKSAKKGRSASSARSAPAPKSSSKKANALSILLIIGLIGGSGYGLYKLSQVPSQPASKIDKRDTQTTQKAPSQAKPSEQPTARFQFYDLLPNSEVETDTVDAYTFKEKGTSEEYSYMLQTGSFKSAKDAERQKATIAFQGLKASIRTVTNSSGSKWHRVQTGPFHSRSEMNAALDKLVAINIQPLVKKNKK